ncbi:MAG TPA: TfoX/Sxy family protein [Ktedonobacterales bacterium]|nr:TfoX/Sxy family protein [Ktedonobacterales bacterium]
MTPRNDSVAGQEQYADLVHELTATRVDVQAGKMFGMPCVKVEGKLFAGYIQGAMVFKLAGETHAHALALPGAWIFDPSGRNRPMREWVAVPAAHANEWSALAVSALEYVAKRR